MIDIDQERHETYLGSASNSISSMFYCIRYNSIRVCLTGARWDVFELVGWLALVLKGIGIGRE